MPRSIDVILCQDVCEQCKPGDRVVLSGCLASIPDVPSLMKPGDVPKKIMMDRNRMGRTESGMTDNTVRGLRRLGKEKQIN